MIWWYLAIFFLALALSAFFSGSETGFYRVTRVRLALDGLGGDRVARWLLQLTNHPALFVATTLIGNNLANYLSSLAIVLLARSLFVGEAYTVELVATLLLTPVVFVYGELLPKNLFYHAPNLLLRRSGPLFLFFVVLFSPVSALLWGLGRALQRLLGESPDHVRLALARQELERMLLEGEEAGILRASQQTLAQNLFNVAGEPVSKFSVPAARFPTVSLADAKKDVLRLARRQHLCELAVRGPKRKILGYLRVVDLYLDPAEEISLHHLHQLPVLSHDDTAGSALMQLQSQRESLARIEDSDQKLVGFVSVKQLTAALFEG
ncbi:CNNM domain-containing protein [Lignipirellula cremea]|uniref:CNNM transmembrane domain-containing protein n=1 Tax=Lignipirellula cremea TaxID=2528010 RepID=A0A518DZT6_9BACT|nr:CNNM domain-containing protein [Lignipirellula cremea]QDU97348.1 hypothetical protein Pla8534_51940 [Lignipirellula cremea]